MTATMTDSFGIPTLSGAAPTGRGYNSNADVQLRTADGRDYNAIWTEFQATLTAFRAGRAPLVNLLTFPVTTLVEDVAQGGQILFERLSEFGIPQSKRVSGSVTSFGYDLNYYGARAGFTSRYLSNASAAQIETLYAAALEADDATTFRLMWQAVFSNVNRTAVIDGTPTVYPVYSLYNGTDGVVPPSVGAKTFDSSHNHYVVSGGATLDSGDVEAAIVNVEEHGFTPANGSTIVILAPTALVNVMKTWRFGGTATNGATPQFDFIPSSGSPTFITPGQGLVGSQVANTFNGLPVSGSYGDAIVIASDYIPAGYFLTFATGGSQVTSNLVGLREHSNPSYRGLRLINGERAGYPLIDSYWEHSIGTGIRQRGAAVVTQVKASGSYDVPTFAGGFE